jgi:predicted dehydrogenase
MSNRISHHTRRQFLRASASILVSGPWLARRVSAESPAANERVNLAIVGAANKGWHNVEQLKSENIVALCDVDANFLARAAQTYPAARQYRDYRKMLDAEQSHVDAVVVSTADHSHAPASSIALDLGKHVYCEKPLTHTVREARVVAELAKRNKRVTQMGTQIHAESNYRRVVELVRSGAIGVVSEVYTWCNKGWSNGRFEAWDQPVPAHLDWDLWLGPARYRPYSPNIHPANWRRFWEYGSGTFGDMACHVMDLPFWALELRHPLTVTCEGPEVHPVGAPEWVKATYEFPANDSRGPVKLYWCDGGAHFPLVGETKDSRGQSLSRWGLGILFVGDKGLLAADYGRWQLLPQDRFAEFQPPVPSIAESIGHWAEWVQGCKTGSPTSCNFDYSGALTEAVLLGTVAYRTGKRLEWNAAELSVANVPEAEQFLSKQYRTGFEVVGI